MVSGAAARRVAGDEKFADNQGVHNDTLTARIPPEAEPLHKDRLARVSRLVKRLCRLAREHGEPPDAYRTEEVVTAALSLSAIARLGFAPLGLSCARTEAALTRLSPGGRLEADESRFAGVASSGPLTTIAATDPELFESLTAALSEPDNLSLLTDPLTTAWALQTLRQKPRWRIAGLQDGSETQSAGGKNIDVAMLPSLTQFFTPEWICRFLVEEALPADGTLDGGLLEGSLVEGNLIDPCCGAGNVLVAALPRLVALERRRSRTSTGEALSRVISEKLCGVDIDRSMVAAAAHALYLESRRIDRYVDLPPPSLWTVSSPASQPGAGAGSLWLGVESPPDFVRVERIDGMVEAAGAGDGPFGNGFAAVVTNPPYLSHRLMPPAVAQFVRKYYEEGRFDLYAAFVLLAVRLLSPGGRLGIVCQQSFMSIKRYEALRRLLLAECHTRSLVLVGPGAFAARTGEKVNNALIVAERRLESADRADELTRCWRLIDRQSRLAAEASGIPSTPSSTVATSRLGTISGGALVFWAPPEVALLFETLRPMSHPDTGITVVNGLFTCDNARFVKHHTQVRDTDRDRYVPYDKGGGGRWYKTTPHMLDWNEDGREIREFRASRGQSTSLPGERFYFQPGLTYTYIGTRGFSARLLSPGSVFDIASSALFSEHLDIHYLLGFLNSALVRFLLGLLNPTINFQVGDLRRLPFAQPDPGTLSCVSASARTAVHVARELDSLDADSPSYLGPALLRYGAARLSDDAYRCHQGRLAHLIAEERQAQSAIDRAVFDLYGLSGAARDAVMSDPWVLSGQRPITAIPTAASSLSELKSFGATSVSANLGRS